MSKAISLLQPRNLFGGTAVLWVVSLSIILTINGTAQILTPAIVYTGRRDPSIPVQSTQAWFSLIYDDLRTHDEAVRTMGLHNPKDSLRALTVQRAQAWITSLQSSPVIGLQLDPFGMLSVAAEQDALAERQVQARLATPGLSNADRAFTLMTAIAAFAKPDYPQRLPIAENYLAQLATLKTREPDAAFFEFLARKQLADTYYRLGRSADVVRVGVRAFELVLAIPFHLRLVVYRGSELTYGAVIDALGGEPDGPIRIRQVNAILRAGATPTPGLIARDSAFYYMGRSFANDAAKLAEVSDRVGQQGTPVMAQYWINRGPTRDSQVVNVADGHIRVIEVGHFTCGPCISAVPGLNRLQTRYPEVDFIFLTWTMGAWGNRLIDVKTECALLTDHFLNKLNARVSIGIAYTTRESTEEGLLRSRILTNTWHADAYPQASKPTFYILDGTGRIRHVILGYTRNLEENLAHIIEFLLREA